MWDKERKSATADFKLWSGTQPSTKARPNRYINRLNCWGQERKSKKNQTNKSVSSDQYTWSWWDPWGVFCWREDHGLSLEKVANTTNFRMLPRNLKQQNYLPNPWQPGTAALLTGTKITHLEQGGDLGGEHRQEWDRHRKFLLTFLPSCSLALHPIYAITAQSLPFGCSSHLRSPIPTWILFSALAPSNISHHRSALVQCWVCIEEMAALNISISKLEKHLYIQILILISWTPHNTHALMGSAALCPSISANKYQLGYSNWVSQKINKPTQGNLL